MFSLFFSFWALGLWGFGVAMDLGFWWVLVGSMQWVPVGSGWFGLVNDQKQKKLIIITFFAIFWSFVIFLV